ncbi:uncharacterized protein K02A2.6-like [Solanum pennellii]|uniref:Uncharacterized protein K02A2.6-like n=1 Tax=Solanum pennellii TaxID=28526 RepID=A0ABM1GKV8_SOLPN|nr:uncharacterized protein K02A2.6-like [Solanum pennellii]
MDVIGPIETTASNGHRFILVSIDYFTKWIEAASYKSINMKVVADFVCKNLICKFGVLESIITDNGENLNFHLMREICDQFKITHRSSTAYRPQMNGAVEAANKNIKMILTKMIDKHRVYGTKAVIPTELEIPSLRIIQEGELSNAEWVSKQINQLTMICEKRMVVVSHGLQL